MGSAHRNRPAHICLPFVFFNLSRSLSPVPRVLFASDQRFYRVRARVVYIRERTRDEGGARRCAHSSGNRLDNERQFGDETGYRI